MQKTNLILAANAGAYCYPWANSADISILPPEAALLRCNGNFAAHFEKIILINGIAPCWQFHPALMNQPNVFFFLWDPARCPYYAPNSETLARLKAAYRVYSFQPEDCADFGLEFNSTMYAPPPPGLLDRSVPPLWDVLFLGVPKDRLPQLRALYARFRAMGLAVQFRIGLTCHDQMPPEQGPGWQITREWTAYGQYLQWALQTRALLDLYQGIQTGYSLRVMESIFFQKKLITNNKTLRHAHGAAPNLYHPNNIFILKEDSWDDFSEWLALPYVPLPGEVLDYFRFENWIRRFT